MRKIAILGLFICLILISGCIAPKEVTLIKKVRTKYSCFAHGNQVDSSKTFEIWETDKGIYAFESGYIATDRNPANLQCNFRPVLNKKNVSNNDIKKGAK